MDESFPILHTPRRRCNKSRFIFLHLAGMKYALCRIFVSVTLYLTRLLMLIKSLRKRSHSDDVNSQISMPLQLEGGKAQEPVEVMRFTVALPGPLTSS